jgi:NADPH-dependent curcumin reductase CurA
MNRINHQVRLAARPVGLPKPSDWSFTEEPVHEPGPDELLVQILYISLDPAMRGWMNEGKSYIAPVGIGDVMRAGAVGRVIASRHQAFPVGTCVSGAFGVQEYAVVQGKSATPVDPQVAELPLYLGTLGMPGLTAYFGLLDIGQPKSGDCVVVSGAAGAVGSVVGQIAKIKNCRVIGIAGGPNKCRYIISELGFDAALDYKAEDVRQALPKLCPNGINIYFDNVGGDILDAALMRLAIGARIPLCGAISQYNNTGPIKGPSNYLSLLVNRATMKGFLVFDFADRYAAAVREMAGWMAAGKLKSREHIVKGLDQFPAALLMLFIGENTGKLVLAV